MFYVNAHFFPPLFVWDLVHLSVCQINVFNVLLKWVFKAANTCVTL